MQHTDALDVTVVVPTFRRVSGLAHLLDELASQEADQLRWEVVVVDNDDAPGVEPVVTARARGFVVPLRYEREGRRGSAHARNRGIAAAAAPVIAFLDDDVVPTRTWLATITGPIAAGVCDGTGGTVVLDPTVARPVWFDEAGLGGYLTAFAPEEREVKAREFVVTANAAFRTDLLRASGGFDPEMGPTGRAHLVGDDALVTRRVQATGGRVRFVPSAVVVHELPAHRLRRSWLIKRAWSQGRSDWRLDRPLLESRRLHGARVAAGWLSSELRRRAADGLDRPEVRFHAACDVARTAGALMEAASWTWR